MVGRLTSQQHASVSQGRICTDNFTSGHTEIEVADPTFYLTQSQNTDTGPTSPSADPIMPGVWQGSYWSADFEVTGMTRPGKKSRRQRDSNRGSSALEVDALTTRPTRRLGDDGTRLPLLSVWCCLFCLSVCQSVCVCVCLSVCAETPLCVSYSPSLSSFLSAP